MNYFVTGATGLLWGLLVQQLVTQQGHIYVLVCESLMENIDALRAQLPAGHRRELSPFMAILPHLYWDFPLTIWRW